MIGSPWNPFFEQSVPGTATRYDGGRVDASDERQFGAYNLQSLPHYLEMAVPVGTNYTYDENRPLVLERQFDLLSTGSGVLTELGGADPLLTGPAVTGLVANNTQLGGTNAEILQVIHGAAWGTQTLTDVFRTGFLWWWNPILDYNTLLPRVLYQSNVLPPTVGEFSGVVGGFGGYADSAALQAAIDAMTPNELVDFLAANDYPLLRWYFAGGVEHPDGSITEHGEGNLWGGVPDWPRVWSAWKRSDGPPSLGGLPIETEADRYPIHGVQGVTDNDIPAGSRQLSLVDLNRPFRMPSLVDEFADSIEVRPWYRPK